VGWTACRCGRSSIFTSSISPSRRAALTFIPVAADAGKTTPRVALDAMLSTWTQARRVGVIVTGLAGRQPRA
jgi:hypothetical protein